MKRNILWLLLLVPLTAIATVNVNNYFEQNTNKLVLGGTMSMDGVNLTDGKLVRSVVEEYDAAVQTIAVAESLGTSLPSGVLVRQVYGVVLTQGTGNGHSTIQCGSQVLFSQVRLTDLTIGTIVAASQDGTPANMFYDSDGCTLTVDTTVASETVGKLKVFVDYVVAQ